jgi:hypothetical protein
LGGDARSETFIRSQQENQDTEFSIDKVHRSKIHTEGCRKFSEGRNGVEGWD